MVEHCPDWAKDYYNFRMDINNNLFYRGITFDKWDEEEYNCIIGQVVAEWLELDQIDFRQHLCQECCVRKKIRFFSDEV